MKDMYLVNLEARPMPGSEKYRHIGGASIDIFLKADCLADAVNRGIWHVSACKWLVTSQQSVIRMTPDRIAQLQGAGETTYRRAEEDGLYSYFRAWPADAAKNAEDDIAVEHPSDDVRH